MEYLLSSSRPAAQSTSGFVARAYPHFFGKCQTGHADVGHPAPRSRQEWDEQKWSMAQVEQLFKIAGEETTTSPASTPVHLLGHDSSLGR